MKELVINEPTCSSCGFSRSTCWCGHSRRPTNNAQQAPASAKPFPPLPIIDRCVAQRRRELAANDGRYDQPRRSLQKSDFEAQGGIPAFDRSPGTKPPSSAGSDQYLPAPRVMDSQQFLEDHVFSVETDDTGNRVQDGGLRPIGVIESIVKEAQKTSGVDW